MKGSVRKSVNGKTMRRKVGVFESDMTFMVFIFSFVVLNLYLIKKRFASVTQFEKESGLVWISTVI